MIQIHLITGLVTVVAVAAAAAWGCAVMLRRRPSEGFFALARVAQAVTAVQVMLGLFVLSGASDHLPSGAHVLAALGVAGSLLGAEALSRLAARRAVASPAINSSAPVALAETAVLTGGFVVVSTFAVLAILTGWH